MDLQSASSYSILSTLIGLCDRNVVVRLGGRSDTYRYRDAKNYQLILVINHLDLHHYNYKTNIY